MIAYIDAHRDRFGVEPICRVLVQIAPSTYYAAKRRPPSARAVRDEELKAEIAPGARRATIGVYGARKVWRPAQPGRDRRGSLHGGAADARAGPGGRAPGKARRTTTPDDAPPSARRPGRAATSGAAAPNRLWVADIERHEALSNRAVVKGHRRRLVAAGRLKLRAA